MNKTFLVGSTYFFNTIKDFKSKDIDKLIIEDYSEEYNVKMQITGKDKCIFRWKKETPMYYVHLALRDLKRQNNNNAMEVGKFLIPEVCEYLGFKIKHLRQLAPIFEKLDDKHKYEKIIFDSYVENKGFFLTDEQLQRAYEEYKKYRN